MNQDNGSSSKLWKPKYNIPPVAVLVTAIDTLIRMNFICMLHTSQSHFD